jgi:hypothetical protein
MSVLAKRCSSKARVGPNVEGNRRAALVRAEDQSMYRRVRLTVRLGHILLDGRLFDHDEFVWLGSELDPLPLGTWLKAEAA